MRNNKKLMSLRISFATALIAFQPIAHSAQHEVVAEYKKNAKGQAVELKALKYLEDVDSTCSPKILTLKIREVEKANGQISGITGVDSKKNPWTVSIDPYVYQSLSRADLSWIPLFIKVDNRLVFHVQLCGSGGFASALSISSP